MGIENPKPYLHLIEMDQTEWMQLLQKEFQEEGVTQEMMIAKTKEEVQLMVRLCKLKHDNTILDMASGQGRHILELRQQGFENVIGMDASKDQLMQTRQPANLIRGDWTYLPLRSLSFDCVMAFLTGVLGARGERSIPILGNVSRVLKPGGRFIADILDEEKVIRRYQTHNVQKGNSYYYSVEENRNGVVYTTTYDLDLTSGLERRRQVWEDNGKTKGWEMGRIIPHIGNLKLLLEKIGLTIVEIYRDYSREKLDDEALDEYSLLVAKKM